MYIMWSRSRIFTTSSSAVADKPARCWFHA